MCLLYIFLLKKTSGYNSVNTDHCLKTLCEQSGKLALPVWAQSMGSVYIEVWKDRKVKCLMQPTL